ncbi:MAG: hypothetical protein WC780_18680 [Lentimicrobiaceae bacterium]
MNKHFLLLILILILPLAIFSQRAMIGNDSITKMINFIEGNEIENSQICREAINGTVVIHTPNDITWYRYNDKKYFSKYIQLKNETKRVFLEQLVTGRIALYYYCDKSSKRFYIERDSTYFIELIEKSGDSSVFRNTLSNYCSDCQTVSEAVNFVRFNKKSLSFFFKKFNSCENRPYPFSKYGLYLGLNSSYLSVFPENSSGAGDLYNAKSIIDHSLLIGFFLDLPIFRSDFTFHPEIYYCKNAFSNQQFQNNIETNIVVNVSAINTPVLIRYTYPFKKVHLFINSGIIYSYLFKNENSIYRTEVQNNIVEIQKESNEELINRNQIKLSFGLGCNYLLNYRNSVFFELRYNSHPFFITRSSTYSVNDLNLNFGVIF